MDSDSIFSQVPRIGDVAAQSPARITKIPPLPTELRLHILEYAMHMIKEPVIILDLYEMPRGNRFPNKKTRFIRPQSQETFPWPHYQNNSLPHALDLIDEFENWYSRRSFYKRRTLGLLSASKECRDFYFSYFPIVLPCGRNGLGQLRIARDEVLHIPNFNTTFNSHHFYQAIGHSYLVDAWWSQLERISFVFGHLTDKFLEELVFFLAKMDSLKVVEVFLGSEDCTRADILWYQHVIGEAVREHNRRYRIEYQMPDITFRKGVQVW